jgi:DNA polymerase III delta prime subunit
MTIQIRKAVKYDSKLRLALAGPSGSGKTYTALTLATALAGEQGVCVIDTERKSASKYADLFTFDVVDLDTFNPLNYIEAIKAIEDAGYGVLVIDSLSHAWNGPGGLLEMVENISKRSQSKNSFNAWGEATPLQNRLIDAITRSKLHVIVTMRTKTEYVIEQNERGKSAPRKVGTAPVQRADVEYEFDVYADLDIDNTLIVHKSRCPELSGAVISKPDGSVAETLKKWLAGAPAPVVPETRQEAQQPPVSIERGQSTATQQSDVKTRLNALYDRAIALGKFSKGATTEESGKAFLVWVSEIVGANIANTQQITASRLDAVEKYLDSAEAA